MNGYRRDIAEPASLEQAWSENITFGVNRGAAFTVISENGATDYPRVQPGGWKIVDDMK